MNVVVTMVVVSKSSEVMQRNDKYCASITRLVHTDWSGRENVLYCYFYCSPTVFKVIVMTWDSIYQLAAEPYPLFGLSSLCQDPRTIISASKGMIQMWSFSFPSHPHAVLKPVGLRETTWKSPPRISSLHLITLPPTVQTHEHVWRSSVQRL